MEKVMDSLDFLVAYLLNLPHLQQQLNTLGLGQKVR